MRLSVLLRAPICKLWGGGGWGAAGGGQCALPEERTHAPEQARRRLGDFFLRVEENSPHPPMRLFVLLRAPIYRLLFVLLRAPIYRLWGPRGRGGGSGTGLSEERTHAPEQARKDWVTFFCVCKKTVPTTPYALVCSSSGADLQALGGWGVGGRDRAARGEHARTHRSKQEDWVMDKLPPRHGETTYYLYPKQA